MGQAYLMVLQQCRQDGHTSPSNHLVEEEIQFRLLKMVSQGLRVDVTSKIYLLWN